MIFIVFVWLYIICIISYILENNEQEQMETRKQNFPSEIKPNINIKPNIKIKSNIKITPDIRITTSLYEKFLTGQAENTSSRQ